MSNQQSSDKKRLFIAIIFLIILVIGLVFFIIFNIFSDKTNDGHTISENGEFEFTFDKDTSTDTATTYFSDSQPDTNIKNTFDPGKLYRPDEAYFCDQYRRFISGNFEGQEYAKMRFGPSKSKYNVVGQIDNGNIVTVETLSVDGWTLVYYEGKEGWVRTDFLFETYEDCFDKLPVYPDIELCGYSALVDVTGEYDGEPLNMRSGLSREYALITTVPDGAWVEVYGQSSSDASWTYVHYNGHKGWVLSKYLIFDGVGDKPVLYLYPQNVTNVNIKVDLSEKVRFSCTYPEYNNGWSVIAHPDGTLINNADNKVYSYLYWELTGKQTYDFSKGFVVKGSETSEFLNKILPELGLSASEINDFIVYWLPRMIKNEYNLITFQSTEYSENVRLSIVPQPDSIIRVFMAYKPLKSYIEIAETPVERTEIGE